MNTHSDKTQENKNQVVVNGMSQKSSGGASTFQFVDNRPETIAQRKLQNLANKSLQTVQTSVDVAQKQGLEEEELLQGKFIPIQMEALEEEELLQAKFNVLQNKGLEEEEPLQGKFNAVQLKAPEEEELLQGKFEPIQMEVLEEEELLQAKFKVVQKKGVEEEEPLQGKFNTVQMKAPEEEELLQGKFEPIQMEASPEPSRRENNTGLPDNLKSGIENLSGYSLDDVKVNFNSNKPAQLNAHAYAQGTDIHVASGQEKHLPHEAWHVVQQKQGRVKPTMQMKGNVNVNDDESLEREADVMGAQAISLKSIQSPAVQKKKSQTNGVAQLASIPGVAAFGNFSDLGNGLFGTTQPTDADEVSGLVAAIRQNTEHQNIKVLTGTHGTADGHLVCEHKFYTEDMAHEGHKIPNGGWINVLDVVGKSKSTIEGWMKPGQSAIILAWCYSQKSVENWENVHHATKSPSDGGAWIW
jgi:hypothetical protein